MYRIILKLNLYKIMSKIKFYLFTDSEKDHRIRRFREESAKKNIDFQIVNLYKIVIQDNQIIDQEGNVLKIKKNDITWILANVSTGYVVSKFLKDRNIQVWPNFEAVAFADKFITNSFFSGIQVPTPKTVFINSYHMDDIIKAIGGFPCIIKKNISTVGKYVEIVKSEKEVLQFIKNTFEIASKNILPNNRISFMLQEFVKEAKGTDYRVLCLDGKILGVIKRTAKSGFKSNISLGGTAKQIPLPEKIKKYTKKILKKGDIFYAGIDFIKKGNEYLAIEVNTSAQFKGFEQATNINVAEKIINKLIEKN